MHPPGLRQRAHISGRAYGKLGGRQCHATSSHKVELWPFHDRALNHDLAEVCTRVAEAAPLLPGGRRLLLCLQGDGHLLVDASERKVA